MSGTGVTAALATTLAGTPPAETMEGARRAVLDWLGVLLAGAHHPTAKIVQKVALGLGASSEASVFPAMRGSAAAAALANGASAHVLELDDLHAASTVHAGAPVIAAALAVAEREHASGADFLRAVVVGFEAALRIGVAVNPSHYRYWHPTGTVATFGAAAAAGKLLKLDAAGMRDALGNAGTQAAGLWEFNADGAMSKPLHAGKAAMNGVLAADLAARGFSGAARMLEGERGFFAAMSVAPKLDAITEGLGVAWRIGENGYKLYPCCGHTHTAIEAAIWVHGKARSAIREIVIETYGPGYEIVKEMRPRTKEQAQFSLAYVTAVALLRGQVTLNDFEADAIADVHVAELLERTLVCEAKDLTARYPVAWPCRLRVDFEDGCIMEPSIETPHGQAGRPATIATLEAKFMGLVAPLLGMARARRLVGDVHALEARADMTEFGLA